MGILKELFNRFLGKEDKEYKCPLCKTSLTLDMERCPGCGTHIDSLFAKRCPSCKELNNLRAEKCKKCGFDFLAHEIMRKKYRCPICGYEMETLMTSCPSCGARFV